MTDQPATSTGAEEARPDDADPDACVDGFMPPLTTCPRCDEQSAIFICSTKGCPMNGGEVYG